MFHEQATVKAFATYFAIYFVFQSYQGCVGSTLRFPPNDLPLTFTFREYNGRKVVSHFYMLRFGSLLNPFLYYFLNLIASAITVLGKTKNSTSQDLKT